MNARQFGILASLVIHGGLYAGVMYFGRFPDKPVTAGVETALTISMFDAVAATPSPEPVEPEPVEPEPVEPEPVEPEPVEPEPVEPEPVEPEPVEPEPVEPEP
ncbi:MAG: hypothetical protein KTR33_00455, partial [Gammaproteobacteria bacterium]|nr:hypothetical protein [Gammaproteobacteria bacterium]